MGCDWVAVRNLTIALGILVGFATSSALFVLFWHRFAPDGPWKPIVTGVSAGAAATWCTAALVVLAVLMSTMSSFCRCAAGVAACGVPCASFSAWAYPLLIALLVLMGMCLVAAADQELLSHPWFIWALAAAVSTATITMGGVAVMASLITMCQ